MSHIVTTAYRPKRPSAEAEGGRPREVPAIVAAPSRKRSKLRLAERAEPVADDPEADAAMRAWLERAK